MFGLFERRCKHKRTRFTAITLQSAPDIEGYCITQEVHYCRDCRALLVPIEREFVKNIYLEEDKK